MEHTFPIADVLRAERSVKAVEMTGFCDLDGWRAFAENLRDGISGHEVNEQKDGGHDQPDHRQGVENALEEGFQCGSQLSACLDAATRMVALQGSFDCARRFALLAAVLRSG